MRFALVAALILPTAAEAHCYSRWHYPTKQNCRAAETHDWYVEITKLPPGWTLDEEREAAIATLKELMNGRVQ
jgi:hypothetical protein